MKDQVENLLRSEVAIRSRDPDSYLELLDFNSLINPFSFSPTQNIMEMTEQIPNARPLENRLIPHSKMFADASCYLGKRDPGDLHLSPPHGWPNRKKLILGNLKTLREAAIITLIRELRISPAMLPNKENSFLIELFLDFLNIASDMDSRSKENIHAYMISLLQRINNLYSDQKRILETMLKLRLVAIGAIEADYPAERLLTNVEGLVISLQATKKKKREELNRKAFKFFLNRLFSILYLQTNPTNKVVEIAAMQDDFIGLYFKESAHLFSDIFQSLSKGLNFYEDIFEFPDFRRDFLHVVNCSLDTYLNDQFFKTEKIVKNIIIPGFNKQLDRAPNSKLRSPWSRLELADTVRSLLSFFCGHSPASRDSPYYTLPRSLQILQSESIFRY